MKKYIFTGLAALLQAFSFVNAQDHFADIATRAYKTHEHLLETPQAHVLPKVYLPATHNKSAVFKAQFPISTKEDLYAELAEMREQYKPFLQDLAPQIQETRSQIQLKEFDWRIGTNTDVADFLSILEGKGEWEKVAIPHYGPPLGRAVTYYRKEVEITSEMIEKGSLFTCFKGVDYKAEVYFNGSFVGKHEGFFAPFEFNITSQAKLGINTILVKVENDYTTTGGKDDKGNKLVGDKIYAATGPGYDDPKLGWHHGSPGMGIYQNCYIEARSPLHINDIFVRPIFKDSVAEAWLEINNFKEYPEAVKLKISIYGQNFKETVVEDFEYSPSTTHVPGVGDLAKPTDWEQKSLKMGYGVNYTKVPFKLNNVKPWNGKTPWLYQIQVKLFDKDGKHVDTQVQQFGMRSFTQDTVSVPKGKMYLNGEMIRLRGANTMGHFQQCVMKEDWEQLIDDVLLAKLCNMNFIRLTQRPVQPEIYDYFDKLGMMHQTDLPLFGAIRRNQFAESVKQAEEMERLIRSHPSSIMVSYINERFPNAEGHPQRSLATLEEYGLWFKSMDQIVLLNNPDRIIKAGDGDYDPPSPGLPDSHCYNTWYNGHGLGLGEMYKGQWQPIKPNWYYACGEFGAEGLDPVNVMYKYYPKEWLPKDKEDEKKWNANRIAMAQTNRFHYMWYNTQHSIEDWVDASQNYQAWAVKFVSETFRRDSRMVSFAIHLFIDAWPAGWMKTIMDVDRQPKKAYFAYRNALEPIIVSLRSDRDQFFAGEETAFEVWISNDLNEAPTGYQLKYQIEKDGKVILANQVNAGIPVNSAKFQGFLKHKVPSVAKRTSYTLRAALVDEKGESVYQNHFDFEVFPSIKSSIKKIFVLGKTDCNATKIVEQAKLNMVSSMNDADVIIVDDFEKYKAQEESVNSLIEAGKKLLFLELPANKYQIAGTELKVEKTNMGDYYFVSPSTNHTLVKNCKPFDFCFWYNGVEDQISPILAYTVQAPEWDFVLASGLSNWGTDKGHVHAAGELKYGKGVMRFCEVKLLDRIQYNPTAMSFFYKLIND